MRTTFLFLFLFSISRVFAQEEDTRTDQHFGVSFASGFLSSIETISIGPSLFYYRNNHQLELGVDFHPANRRFERKIGGEILYKYFPEGDDKRVNMFYMASATITKNDRYQSMWSGDYRRKELNAAFLIGLGGQINLFKGAFIGVNLNVGTSTYKVDATNDYYDYPMFKYYNFERAIRINLGYRF